MTAEENRRERLLLAATGIFEKVIDPAKTPAPKIEKMTAIQHVAKLFVDAGPLAIRLGIPNHIVARAKRPGFSGTHRISEIRHDFALENEEKINPIVFNTKTRRYHAANLHVVNWLKLYYLGKK